MYLNKVKNTVPWYKLNTMLGKSIPLPSGEMIQSSDSMLEKVFGTK